MTATRIDPVRLGMWIALVAVVVCVWSTVLWIGSLSMWIALVATVVCVWRIASLLGAAT